MAKLLGVEDIDEWYVSRCYMYGDIGGLDRLGADAQRLVVVVGWC